MKLGTYKHPLNDHSEFLVSDCYAQKDILKANGFRWDSESKAWTKKYKTATELSRMVMETMMLCDCPFEVFEDMECEELEDISVWDRELFCEFCTKYDLTAE